jgi:hypothetical protein
MARKALPDNAEVLVALLQDAQQFLRAAVPLVHQFRMQDRLLKLAIEDPHELVRRSAFAAQLHREIDKNIAALGPYYEHLLDYMDIDGPTATRILDGLNGPRVGPCPASKSAEIARKLVGMHAAFDAMVAPIRRLYGEIRERLADRPSPALVDPPQPQPRITVDRQGSSVVLDRVFYRMREGGADFVQALINAGGDWVSSTEIAANCSNLASSSAINKIRWRLPKPISDLIEGKQGTGYRLKLG